MIYCPKCKTANRDGSRFCNECGEPFSRHTEVRCPNCGAANSIQSAFCGDCGGRLLSSSTPGAEGVPTIKGLSLPTKASMDDDQDEEAATETAGAEDAVPGWLRELGSTGRSEDQPPEPPAEDGAEAVPEWLQDLRASLPDEEPAEMTPIEGSEDEAPDWLSELRPATQTSSPEMPAPAPEVPEAEEVPDWLAGLRSADKVPEAPGEAPEAEEVPDWLAGLRSAEEAPVSDGDALEQVPGTPAEVPEAEVEPDWLAELRSAEEGPVSDGDALEQVPGIPVEVPGAEEVPDWLAEQRAAEEVPASEAGVSGEEGPEALTETPEDELSPWLAGLRAADEEPVFAADASEADAPGADVSEADGPAAEVFEAPTEVSEDLPPWLAELHAAEDEPASVADVSAPGVSETEGAETLVETTEEDTPDWLAALRPAAGLAATAAVVSGLDAPEADASEADASEADVSEADVSEADTVGAEVPEAVSEGEEEPPDWLAELREAEEPPPSEADASEADVSEEVVSEGDVSEADVSEEDVSEEVVSEADVSEEVVSEEDSFGAEVSEAEEAAMADTSEEDDPDWLAALGSAAGLAAVAAVASDADASDAEVSEADDEALVETPEGDIPDWLAQLPSAEEALASETETSEVEGAETAVSEADAPESLVVTPEEDFPEWLAELRPAETGVAAEAGVEGPEDLTETVGIEDVPPWLAGIEPGEEAIVPEADVFVVPHDVSDGEEGEAPEWLAEIPPAEETDESDAMVAGAAIAAAAVPGWLAELRPDSEEAPPVPQETVVDEGELPEWLVPTQEMDGEGLARAEIPDWLLALKPSELREGEPLETPEEIEVAVEETGLLAGLSGTLPAEMLIVQPRAAAPPVEAGEAVDDAHARLFAEIVGQPPAVTPTVVEQPRTNLMAMLPRWIVYIALLGVVALPIMLGKPLLPRTPAPVPAMVSDLYDSIAALSANAPVLVAFDYDPTTSGEMDVVAQAIVGHLMDQDARIAVVSSLPAGPPTAQNLLDKMASERPDYADSYGQRYVNLGFLPGQASAVWRMGLSMEGALPQDFTGTPLGDLPAMKGISSLSDFDLVIELTANQNTLRWWVEQAVAPYDIPLGAGVSAAIEPAARAYYETDPQQLVGLVAGVLGAASYESLSSDEGQPQDTTGARLDGQLGGHVIFVLVIVAGVAVYFVRRGTGRER